MSTEPKPADGRETSTLPRLWTVKEVAVYLAVKEDRIYELVWARRLRAHRVGRQLRFRLNDIEAFLNRYATGE